MKVTFGSTKQNSEQIDLDKKPCKVTSQVNHIIP